MRKKLIVCVALLLSLSVLAAASSKTVLDVPKFSKAPKIDGVLDNPIWQKQALKIDTLYQMTPKEMGLPSERTEVYIGYDEKNIYFAFRCWDSEPDKIRASITSRDRCMEDDWITVFLDTFNEKRRSFCFIINPLGVQMDSIRVESGGNDNMDDSWDTMFYSDGKIDETGYTVEMSIPFKSLRFPDMESKVWGIVLGRNIPRKGEIIIWPDFTREIPGLLSQAGEIKIQGRVEKGKNFEFMPVATSLKTKESGLDVQPGLNFKWGVSSDMTMDMTLNPDFSHIEADAPQIDVNQRFALYYSEKRPFFLEGMEIFKFPRIDMVYTRRIIDPIAGAKLTGKTGRFTYGFLSALDTSPTESLWDVSSGNRYADQNALFNIFRVKADVFNESYLGFCLADKEINGSYNRVAGVDGQFRFKNKFFLSFQALASKTRFEDRNTGLAPSLYARFSYYSKHWGAGIYWQSMHPDFEASSGFVNRVDYKSYGAFTYYRLYPQKKYMNQITFSLDAGQRESFYGGTHTDRWTEAEIQLRFTEFNQMNIEFTTDMERYEGVRFHKSFLTLESQNMLIGWLPFGFFLRLGEGIYYDPDDPFLGWSHTYGMFVSFKPNKRLRFDIDFSKETFWKGRGGEQLYDFNVLRQRTTYQFSKTLSLRAILDYNLYLKQIYGSFLVSYVYRPGTVFFFGIDNNLLKNDLGAFRQSNYSVFVKFSYWVRI